MEFVTKLRRDIPMVVPLLPVLLQQLPCRGCGRSLSSTAEVTVAILVVIVPNNMKQASCTRSSRIRLDGIILLLLLLPLMFFIPPTIYVCGIHVREKKKEEREKEA
jgi:hypothetical protein